MDTQRRVFLKGMGAVSMACMLPIGYAQPIDPSVGLGTRRSVSGMSPDDPVLETYRAAVEAMRALPSSDPRNWERQALIHQNRCPHGNWYFLPWHRAYLHRFEAICRALTGDDGFRLPYWDWSSDSRVPMPFWGPDNPLTHPRSAGPNDRALAEMVGRPVVEGQILPEDDFEQFASGASSTQRGGAFFGPLEGRPHNHIHGFVGGDMQSFMSPRDPVFWLHHANVDRIWALWNARGHGNTAESGWRDFVFDGDFADAAGNPVSVPVSELEDTRALGYFYDDPGSFDVPAPTPRLAAPEAAAISFEAENDQPSVPGRPVSVPVPANVAQLRRAVSSAQAAGPDRVFVDIGGIEAPTNEQIVVRVFVNSPDVTSETPVSDAHFAGSFAFFELGHAARHGHAPASYRIELTETLRRLAASGEGLGSELKVQLLSLGLSGRELTGAEFTAHKVAVFAQ